MRTKIAITGAEGMLGIELVKALKEDCRLFPLTLKKESALGIKYYQADILKSEQLSQLLLRLKPDVIIHAAALTDVDDCELHPDIAYQVNVNGTRNVALVAKLLNVPLLYVSTDFVFNGERTELYSAEATPCPISVYGFTKYMGERMVREYLSDWWIVRTSWLFGAHGKNFVNTILRLAEEKETITMIGDQYGCPTYAADLAQAIKRIVKLRKYGTYHVCNKGVCNWYGFAQEIIRQKNLKLKLCKINSSESSRPAERPKFSGMDTSNFEKSHKFEMRSWREALKEYLGGEK